MYIVSCSLDYGTTFSRCMVNKTIIVGNIKVICVHRYKAVRDMPFYLRGVSCLTPAKLVLNVIKKSSTRL